MSCNICGGENKMFYCKENDCNICEECLNMIDKSERYYCNSFGCRINGCEHRRNCKVVKARKEQIKQEMREMSDNKY